MKIISKFKDYYDSALGYGVDMSQVLVRTQTDFITDIQLPNPLCMNKKYTFFTLGFCGKWIRGVKAKAGNFDGNTECFYSPTLLSSSFFNKKDIQEMTNKIYSYHKSTPLEEINKWLEGNPVEWYSRDIRYKRVVNKLTDSLFVDNKCSVILIEKTDFFGRKYRGFDSTAVVTLWPKLSDYNFQKVVDPYTTFQEISMYQFGVLGCTEKDTVDISDKDRYDMKGFDMEYGFRKRPKG